MAEKKIAKKCVKCTILPVKIELLHPDAKVPTTAYKEDVGYDLYAVEDCEIPFGGCKDIPTGIAVQVPKGFYCTVETRSSTGRDGHAAHRGIIDPGYTGEITAFIRNVSTNSSVKAPKVIKRGDKIAQLTFHRAFYVKFDVVDELDQTERGDSNCGSSDE